MRVIVDLVISNGDHHSSEQSNRHSDLPIFQMLYMYSMYSCDLLQMTALNVYFCHWMMQVIIAGGLRPKAFSYLRRWWNVVHWNLGRIVLAMGIVNLYIGMSVVGVSAGYYIALSVILAFWLVVAVIKDSIDILCMPPVAMVPEGDRERAIYSNQPLMTRGDRYYAESNKNAGPAGHALGKGAHPHGTDTVNTVPSDPAVSNV